MYAPPAACELVPLLVDLPTRSQSLFPPTAALAYKFLRVSMTGGFDFERIHLEHHAFWDECSDESIVLTLDRASLQKSKHKIKLKTPRFFSHDKDQEKKNPRR